MKAHLEDGKLAKSFECEDEEALAFLNSLNLLTWKPVIFAANVAEDELADDAVNNQYVASVREFAAENDSEVFVICAQIEQEIAELDDEDFDDAFSEEEFLDQIGDQLGIAECGTAGGNLVGTGFQHNACGFNAVDTAADSKRNKYLACYLCQNIGK